MGSERILFWPFQAAPENLRLLQAGLKTPDWLAFVPRSLFGKDLNQAIMTNSPNRGVKRYSTPEGDIVYTGYFSRGAQKRSGMNRIRPGKRLGGHGGRVRSRKGLSLVPLPQPSSQKYNKYRRSERSDRN